MPPAARRRGLPALVAVLAAAVLLAAPAAHAQAPANDDFADATVLTVAGGDIPGSTLNATREPGEPDTGDEGTASVWYAYTPSSSGYVSVLISGCDPDIPNVGVYTGDAVDQLELVERAWYCDGGHAFYGRAGTTYHIAVEGDYGTELTFGIDLESMTGAPPNDNFEASQFIRVGSSTWGSNANATEQHLEPDHAGDPGGSSVWFHHYTYAGGGMVLDTCESGFDTVLAVYEAQAFDDTLDSVTPIASADGGCPTGDGSRLTFDADSETTYYVAVDGAEGAEGEYLLRFEPQPPENDDFADAEPVDAEEGNTVDTRAATREAGEPDHAGDPGGASVWFTYAPTQSSHVELDVYRYDGETAECVVFDTLLAVYTGSAVDALTPVAANDDEAGPDACGSGLEFFAHAGQVYSIAVDGYGGAKGIAGLSLFEGVACTVVGTAGSDKLTGTDGPDVLCGIGGNDTLTGGDAGDVLLGGAGSDRISDGPGQDEVAGGSGSDVLVAGPDNDNYDGGPGSDTVSYAARTAPVEAEVAAGAVVGGESDDFTSVEHAEGGSANDDLTGDDASNRLTGNGGDDTLAGFDGDDVLDGGAGQDDLQGDEGDDLLRGGLGKDDLIGGDGIDTMTYGERSATQRVSVRLDGLANDGADPNGDGASAAGEEGDRDQDVERAAGGAGADRFFGDAGDNGFDGGTGNDWFDGGAGADTFDGGEGVDTLSYAARGAGERVAVRLDGLANDGADPNGSGVSTAAEEGDADRSVENADGSAGPDRLLGGAAANVLKGGLHNDTLDGGLGADTLDGEGGTDTLSYSTRSGRVAVKLDGFRNDGADPNGSGTSAAAEEGDLDRGIEGATGGTGADILFGHPGVNTLKGGRGDDRLDGGLGGDTLDGGLGIDTISYATRTSSADRLVIKLDGFRNDGADPNASGQSGVTEEGDLDLDVENAVGGAGPDRLIGNTLLNILTGGAGDDRIEARDDTTLVDQLICGSGTDSYTADASDTRTACETALP